MPSANYRTVVDAATGLLAESVALLNARGDQFVVMGGWSPLLLNSDPIHHPGTRDVDILFAEGATAGALKDVVRAFLDAGYLPSAKHPFQLLRVLSVEGQEMVFNVDLLHPRETGDDLDPGMFVDHADLGVALSPYLNDHVMMRSIVTPRASFILTDRHYAELPLRVLIPDGQEIDVTVPLADELALIVTKSECFQNPKRDRDAFDIALAVGQCRDRDLLVKDARQLQKGFPEEFSVLGHIREALTSRRERNVFIASLEKYVPASHHPRIPGLLAAMEQFLDDAKVVPKESARVAGR